MDTNPIVSRPKRIAYINVIGRTWYNQRISYTYELSDYHLENIPAFTREDIQDWLDKHAGDFQVITDFCAQVGANTIDWQDPQSEDTLDMMRE